MKRWLIAAVVLLLLSVFILPAQAGMPLEEFAHWAGADKNLDFAIDRPDGGFVNGYFMEPGQYCFFWMCREVKRPIVRVIIGKDVPEDVAEFVIAHELGHYKQYRQGYLHARSIKDMVGLEQDADRLGQQAMCKIGKPHAGEDFFTYLKNDGYMGDPFHGTVEQRIDVTRHACDTIPEQGP